MKKYWILPAISFVVLFLSITDQRAFCPVSFFPGDVACDAQGEFGWIGPYHQGATVSPNSQINVSVTGGCPPYTWSLSGSGYWLVNDFTYNEDNTVYTDSDIACSATISVLDRYGSQPNSPWASQATSPGKNETGQNAPDSATAKRSTTEITAGSMRDFFIGILSLY